MVKYGTRYLHIRVKDAKSGHTVVLQNSADKILVIDQKGENEISALRLANPDGSPLEKGEYKLTVTAMLRSTSYTNSWEDGFWIV